MLEELLNHMHNRFQVEGARLSGDFVISSGTINLPGIIPGQYFWVVGSVLNDGLHQYPATDLQDETFRGYIIPAAIPQAVLRLAERISDWTKAHPDTDIVSESFGGYSYTRAAKDGKPATWQDVFASEIRQWRKMV